MVKRSKKSKSKRVPLKKKHKIIKKVKEHHKKKAKEAKKLGFNQKQKVEKDPGIPNDWPFKEQELKALEARRAKAIEELEQKKIARKEKANKRKLGLLDDEAVTEPTELASSGNPKDNSERSFYKELVKVIEASDVIVEVLDARDPLGTRCLDMEKMVVKSGPEKHLVLLLNKIDLVPREAVEKWLKYLREELPAVAFKCSTQEQRSNYGWKSASKSAKPSNLLQTSDCLGAETLIKLLKNYSRSHEIKKSITVGVIGLPNVGKSSLINSLRRCHVVNVGATPGLTRSMQEVQLDKNVKLLDCPGVVMINKTGESEERIALRNCKRIEKLSDPVGPVKEILKLCPSETLVSLYKLPSFETVDDFLQKVATVRGKLKKGGIVDVESAARIVLRDWNEGKIPYYTLPPSRNQEVFEATIVQELGKEFNVDEVYKGESSFIGSLKSVEDFRHIEVPPNGPLNFDEKMVEEELRPAETREDEQVFYTPEEMAGDDDVSMDDNQSEKGKTKTGSSKQNEKLYTAEGILNPKQQRAEKKRRKKASKALADGMDADYDFKVDYKNKGASMEVVDEGDEADDADGDVETMET